MPGQAASPSQDAPFVEAERLNPPKSPGAPPFVPTPSDSAIVAMCASQGYSVEVTASMVRWETGGISVDTLLKYFRRELEKGRTYANLSVAMRTYSFTTNPDPKVALRACMFWSERRDPLRWGRNLQPGGMNPFGRGPALDIEYDDGRPKPSPPVGARAAGAASSDGPGGRRTLRFHMDRISAVSDPDALEGEDEDEDDILDGDAPA